MDFLQESRAVINEIDAQMAALYEQRMHAVANVAKYKEEHGLPVFDAAREAQVIERNTARIEDEVLRPYYRDFIISMMDIAKGYERELMAQDVAAYQGVQGAWSHIALQRMFPHSKATAYATWADVLDAVEQGQAAQGVLPFENSNAGDVSAVLDLLYAHPQLHVTAMYDLPIRQDLLALPGTKLEDIETVISHQQALAQSGPFLKMHGFATESWANTAGAARYVAESGNKTLAAIASAETAKLYGLEILAEGINEDGDNTTRFVVVERKPAVSGGRAALLFTVDHKPGKLATVIQRIGQLGYNMESIKSRPLPHVQFEYYFYVQLICPQNEGAAPLQALLDELNEVCRTVRVLGVFDCANR